MKKLNLIKWWEDPCPNCKSTNTFWVDAFMRCYNCHYTTKVGG